MLGVGVGGRQDQLTPRSELSGRIQHSGATVRVQSAIDDEHRVPTHHDADIRDQIDAMVWQQPDTLGNLTGKPSVHLWQRVGQGDGRARQVSRRNLPNRERCSSHAEAKFQSCTALGL